MYSNPFHTIDLSTKTILVTGAAGFIGSHICEYLLKYGAKVVAFDNMESGLQANVDLFSNHPNYTFVKGDIKNLEDCLTAVKGVDAISHQAALGSVPRSIKMPLATHEANVTGFLNILEAAKANGVKRIVYASSSSVYGDSLQLPKVEDVIGNPLSPYAVSKYSNELYANVYASAYGLELIGFRYFNIFGPRQDPQGEYAAVIPLFMKAMLSHSSPFLNGNGEQTRDFTFVENAVQANVKGLFIEDEDAVNQVYNIACGERVSLKQLVEELKKLTKVDVSTKYRNPREGDIQDSLANISKARNLLGYDPHYNMSEGLKLTLSWFQNNKDVLGI